MSNKPKIELFKGSNSEECTAFIRAIRETAWAEGRLRDPAWMADFASLHFSGKAMSWYGKLPLDVRQDWFKLEEALIDRWAPPDEDDDSHIQPVPAAAPKPAGIGGSDYVVCGVLKLVPDDVSVAPAYVQSNPKTCGPTLDKEAAIHLRFHPRSNYGLLELTGSSEISWLALHWSPKDPVFSRSSTSWAALTTVSSDNLKSAWEDHDAPYGLMKCRGSPTGELTPTWKDANNREISLGVFFTKGGLFIAVDPEAYARKYPNEPRAKFFIEPIN